MSMNRLQPAISFVSEHGILLEFTSADSHDVDHALQQRLHVLARLLAQHAIVGPLICDLITAPGSLLILLHDGATARRVLRHTETLWNNTTHNNPQQEQTAVKIPVRYGGSAGPDLAAAAQYCGLSITEFISCHSSADYVVHNIGFMPGFAYLSGLPEQLHLPRKTTPAVRVPAGSVAIGGSFSGIYPTTSPGGWHIIGYTSLTLFNVQADTPCLLRPGDRVQFVIEESVI
jgi:5-oxoprolinase (ATP-hydrolysing) subunit B